MAYRAREDIDIAGVLVPGVALIATPFIATAMEADLGWDKTLIYGSATLGALLSAVLAIPIGHAIDGGRGELVMASVSVHAGLLMVLWALTDNIVLFYMGSAGVGALLHLSGWRAVQVALGQQRYEDRGR